jgi:hypothetical protein
MPTNTSRSSCRTPPVLSPGLQHLRAEHNVAILAALPTLEGMIIRSFAGCHVNIGDLQPRPFRAPHSSGIERHQQNVMKGSDSRVG